MKKAISLILIVLCLLQLAACRRVPNSSDIYAVVPQTTSGPTLKNVTAEIEDLDESIFNRNIKLYKAWPNFFGDISMQSRIRAHSNGNYELEMHLDDFIVFNCSVPLSDITVMHKRETSLSHAAVLRAMDTIITTFTDSPHTHLKYKLHPESDIIPLE